MKQPKIFFVAPSAYTLGGVANWLYYLDEGLQEIGWATVVGLAEGREWHKPGPYLEKYPHRNWASLKCYTGTIEGRRRAICKALEKAAPDLVVGVNMPDTYAAAQRYRRRSGKRLVSIMAIHGLQADLFEDVRREELLLNAIICTNKLSKAFAARQCSSDNSQTYYAPYGVCLDNLPARKTDRKQFTIGYSGRLDEFQKRTSDLIKIIQGAVHRIPGVQFMIAGTGPEEQALRSELKEFILCGRVQMLGQLNSQELFNNFYSSLDALLVASYWETGPIVAWEAMSMGVPLVSTRYIGSGLESALVHRQTALLYEIGHCHDAVEQLILLSKDLVLWNDLAKKGRRLVEERYSKKISIESWSHSFKKILSAALSPVDEQEVIPSVAGRLDKYIGPALAENVRKFVRSPKLKSSPAHEWPHSYGKRKENDADFWEEARKLDACPDCA